MGATLSNILDKLAVAVQPLFAAVLDVINGVLGKIQEGVEAIAPWIQAVATLIGGVVNVISGVLGSILNIIGDIFGRVIAFFGNLVKSFILAGAQVFGAFANGICGRPTTSFSRRSFRLRPFIADFLEGHSPPKKGRSRTSIKVAARS